MLASAHGEIGSILNGRGRFRESQEHLNLALADTRSRWPGFFAAFPQPLVLSLLGWTILIVPALYCMIARENRVRRWTEAELREGFAIIDRALAITDRATTS